MLSERAVRASDGSGGPTSGSGSPSGRGPADSGAGRSAPLERPPTPGCSRSADIPGRCSSAARGAPHRLRLMDVPGVCCLAVISVSSPPFFFSFLREGSRSTRSQTDVHRAPRRDRPRNSVTSCRRAARHRRFPAARRRALRSLQPTSQPTSRPTSQPTSRRDGPASHRRARPAHASGDQRLGSPGTQ
jgi:hypothetical protein